MSFGLGHGRTLDPGRVMLDEGDLPPLPDDLLTNPAGGWIDPGELFPEPGRPFEIEIGPGKGAFLIQQGALSPEVNYLGIEWAGEFATYTADRIRRRGLDNVRVLRADATSFLTWRVPTASARVVHLYFSDPWPKKRHHKKRVVRDEVLATIRRVLRPNGELRVVTDHAEYWAWMEEHFARWTGNGPTPGWEGPHPAFECEAFEAPESAGESELVGTNFERKYVIEGRSFNACVLRVPSESGRSG